ncbi:MAG: sigma-54-dependent Fis family transcriptional regulator, partial [Calditrichaceae bacterium]|nr:sigma-54-dependent Fis family transcriptional regulator [Calditrichaceae bacterium]
MKNKIQNIKPFNIVVVDDNDTMRLGMAESLRRQGYTVCEFTNGPAALEHLKENKADLLITDLRMEPINGIELLERVKKNNPSMEALLVSAYGTVDDAVKAMHLGAADFLTKPFSPDELRARVNKIIQKIENESLISQLQDQNAYFKQEITNQYDEMVGSTPVMREIFKLIDTIAKEDSSILIEGESGTGKELVAHAIHRKSDRTEQPFIRVNSGALNDNLLESELFGHEKGAFTGAIRQKKGRMELAHGGTLFLDEIGDISPAMQVKLLRAIQEKEFERVGGEETLKVDVRIIAATNKSLQDLVHNNKFREDLFYRLSVIPIRLPSLRERKDDIPALIQHFLNQMNQRKSQHKTISKEAVDLLKQYTWPGNIRELENIIERLFITSPDIEISINQVSRYLGHNNHVSENYDNIPLDDALFNLEKKLIMQALKDANGVKNRAAK